MKNYTSRSFTRGKTNWGYLVVLIVLTFLVGCGVFGYSRFIIEEISSMPPLPEVTELYKNKKCGWKPSKDYGTCKETLGVYYDGENCQYLEGCSGKENKIPFQSIEKCKNLCERKNN